MAIIDELKILLTLDSAGFKKKSKEAQTEAASLRKPILLSIATAGVSGKIKALQAELKQLEAQQQKNGKTVLGDMGIASAKRKIKDANEELAKTEGRYKKIQAGLKDVADGFADIKNAAFSAAGVIAGAALGLVGLSNSTTGQINNLSLLSKETGLSTLALKAHSQAAERNKTSAEAMTAALRKAATDQDALRSGKQNLREIDTSGLLTFGLNQGIIKQADLTKSAESYFNAVRKTFQEVAKRKGSQRAVQVLKDSGFGDVAGVMESETFDKDVADIKGNLSQGGDFKKKEKDAEDYARAMTKVTQDFSNFKDEIMMQAIVPELQKIAAEWAGMSADDKKEVIKTVKELVKDIAGLAKSFYKLVGSEKEGSGESFSLWKSFKNLISGTVGWKNAIEILLGLKVLSWLSKFSGAGLLLKGAMTVVTGSIGMLGTGIAAVTSGAAGTAAIAFFTRMIALVGSLSTGIGVLAAGFAGFKIGEKLQEAFPQIQSTIGDTLDKAAGINQNDEKPMEYAPEKYQQQHGTGAGGAFAKKGWSKNAGNTPQLIEQISKEQGLDPVFMKTMAMIESGGNAKAYNPSSASGVYQFITSTGRKYGLNDSNKFDAVSNIKAGAAFTKDNIAALKKRGIEATPANLYMAHQQGVGGLADLIKAANGGQVSAGLRRNMNANSGKGKTAKQFLDYWTNSVNALYNKNLGSKGIPLKTGSAEEEEESVAPSHGGRAPSKLRIKSKEAIAGGKTEQGTFDLAQMTQDMYSGSVKHFSAFNDRYHQGTSSGHAKGLKFDMSLNNPKEAEVMAENIRNLIAKSGAKGKVLNEYADPSKRATGGHLDVGFQSAADAEKFSQFYRAQQQGKKPPPPPQLQGTGNKAKHANQGLPYAMPMQAAEYNNNRAAPLTNVTITQNNNISSADPKGVAQEVQQNTSLMQNTIAKYVESGYKS